MPTQVQPHVVPHGLPPSQITRILQAMLLSEDKHSLLITGEPGIGKTHTIKAAVREIKQEIVFTDLGTADPTNANGYPWVIDGKAVFLPFGDLRRCMESEIPIVWFWDDLGWAEDSVQKAFAHGLDEGRFGDIVLNNFVTIVAATNLRGQGAGVTGILEPVKTRFTTILPFKVNFEDFKAWWLKQLLPLEPIAFLSQEPALLHSWKPEKDVQGQPVPRAWEAVGKIMRLPLSAEDQYESIRGTIGHVAAQRFTQVLRDMQESIDLDAIIRDPKHAEIPNKTRISALFAISTGLSRLATMQNFGNICTYMTRVADEGFGDLAQLILNECTRRNMNLMSTKGFIELVKSGTVMGDLLGSTTVV